MVSDRKSMTLYIQKCENGARFYTHETATVSRPPSEVSLDPGLYDKINREIKKIAESSCAASPSCSFSAANDLKRLGQLLFEQLFPREIKEILASEETEALILRIEAPLLEIPWELAHNGKYFIGNHFHIGRNIFYASKKEQALSGGKEKINILIIQDPTETLPGVQEETEALTEMLDSYGSELNVEVMGGRDTDKFHILKALKTNIFDFIHFTGHSDFNPEDKTKNGWRLADNVWLTSEEIGKIENPPILIFSNSCSSARMQSTGIQTDLGLGGSFLVAGVKHYIGTLWDIHDRSSAEFAKYFYTHLLTGASIGEALCHAKQQSMRSQPDQSFIWTSYVHYGNPKDRPFFTGASDEEKTLSAPRLFSRTNILIAALLLMTLLLGYGYRTGNRSEEKHNDLLINLYTHAVSDYKAGKTKSAMAAFDHLIRRTDNVKGIGMADLAQIYAEAGIQDRADQLLEEAIRINPEGIMGHILTGDRYWQKGLPEQAAKEYLYALEDPHASDWQAARAGNALGLIAFLTGNMQKSQRYFEKALSRADGNTDALSNMGVLAYVGGNRKKAEDYFKKTLEKSPDDEIAGMFLQLISQAPAAPAASEAENLLSLAAGPFLFFKGTVCRIGADILLAEAVSQAVRLTDPKWKCQIPQIYGSDYPSFRINRLTGQKKLTEYLNSLECSLAVFGEYSQSEHVFGLHLKIADIRSGKIYADKYFRAEANKKMEKIITDIKATIQQSGIGRLGSAKDSESLKSD